ncbi:MAG TPA: polymer-forming cytoskeletal protein [Gemmatimonadaceae bacterium]
MTIFGKEGGAAPRSEPRNTPVAEAPMSIISSSMRIKGDIECTGVVKVDGHIDGSVTGARQVLLGRGGKVHGNVVAGEIVIGGVVDGSINAGERLELQASAVVNGDIDAKSIVVLEGARVNGAVRMSDAVAAAAVAPRPARSSDSLRIATSA